LLLKGGEGRMQVMNRRLVSSRGISMIVGLLLFLDGPRLLMAEPTAVAVRDFEVYCRKVEAQLAEEHRSASSFIELEGSEATRLRGGDVVIEKLSPSGDLAGATLHDWRGTAFAPGATAADFERLMRDFEAYPQHFSPQVLAAKTIAQDGDRVQAWMRVRQRHVIIVVMDSRYDITFGQMDARHGYSISRSTEIDEIDDAGTAKERRLRADEEHGFMWRLNTYWSCEERDGGLYLQVEAVSLTRSVPRGLGWAIGPYVERVPRESLEFTLRSAVKALRR
jgi:hypothetical protein